MRRVLLSIAVLLSLLAITLPPTRAHAQTANPRESCQVQVGSQLSRATRQTLSDCALLIGAAGAQAGIEESYGYWNGYLFVVNNAAEIYYQQQNKEWKRVGTLPDSDRDGIAYDACPSQAETRNSVFDDDGCADTIDDLIDPGIQDINSYWQGIFASNDLRYYPPEEVVAYTPNQLIRTACGRAVPNNAFYCGRAHSIYYDVRFLNNRVLQMAEHGDFGLITVLAHEWGHLIQAQLDGNLVPSTSVGVELQADCFAGAYAAHVAAGRSEVFRLEEGDLEEGATLLYNLGDPYGTPWFDPQAHGTQDQRAEAFRAGLNQGLEACFR